MKPCSSNIQIILDIASVLWAAFTVIAAGAQVIRNAMQRDLTATLGTLGATQVRFLFGFPFGLVMLGIALVAMKEHLPALSIRYLLWVFGGSIFQIAATAMMLKAMSSRSFVVTTAYTKTEPVQVALFGLIFLGDSLSMGLTLAILVATSGVMLLGWPQKPVGVASPASGNVGPALLGLAAGGCFALSAILFRGAIHTLEGSVSTWVRASTTLAFGLGMQTSMLLAYLLIADRGTLRAIGRAWKPSMLAGFMGAAASQFWFLGFALTSAARVRTLALVEVLFAYAISGRVFKERLAPREIMGLCLVIIGVGLSLNS